MKFCFVQSNGEKRETKQLRCEKFLAPPKKLQPGNMVDCNQEIFRIKFCWHQYLFGNFEFFQMIDSTRQKLTDSSGFLNYTNIQVWQRDQRIRC